MTIPENITKDHLLQAISKIDEEGIPKNGDSQYYDVIYNGKKYPPKLIVSYANIFANGKALTRRLFDGGMETPCFNLLKTNGFLIESKSEEEDKQQKIWIEKSLINGRSDRLIGERALGKAVWSPRTDRRGGDIYRNLRAVRKGDIILHFVDNRKISGISIVKNNVIETDGVVGTAWDGPSYLIELENFTELFPPINRTELLSEENKELLLEIAKHSEVFYNRILDLRQGAYLTPCPYVLLQLINETYKRLSNQNLPFIENIDFNSSNVTRTFITPKVLIPFDLNTFIDHINVSGLQLNKKTLIRFTSSLLTKPFVILTGLSGSGKTKLAQAFAMWICENDNQYCIVPVGADWTNREPLLGFPNALISGKYVKPDNRVLDLIIAANNYLDKPYFLILDEMNLSHVERYFADFLSVMETKDGKISLHADSKEWDKEIPSEISLSKNLFIIGTVNIDETTYMFSPKVLDRANVIEFRVTHDEMADYFKASTKLDLKLLTAKGANMAGDFVKIATDETLKTEFQKELQDELLNFFIELKKSGAEFGYRSASEILRFAAVVNVIEPTWTISEIIDAAIMQKLLPKVHGSKRKLEPVLKTLGTLCLSDGHNFTEFINSNGDVDFENDGKIKYPLSLEKIHRMYFGLIHNGFTSYAEA